MRLDDRRASLKTTREERELRFWTVRQTLRAVREVLRTIREALVVLLFAALVVYFIVALVEGRAWRSEVVRTVLPP